MPGQPRTVIVSQRMPGLGTSDALTPLERSGMHSNPAHLATRSHPLSMAFGSHHHRRVPGSSRAASIAIPVLGKYELTVTAPRKPRFRKSFTGSEPAKHPLLGQVDGNRPRARPVRRHAGRTQAVPHRGTCAISPSVCGTAGLIRPYFNQARIAVAADQLESRALSILLVGPTDRDSGEFTTAKAALCQPMTGRPHREGL